MSENKVFQTSLAVIADIHGNRWALEAVLQDIDQRGIEQIVNLGDHLTGPLDPAGTADLLIERWLRTLPATAVVAGELFVCHGDLFDAPYLLEQVAASGVPLRSTREIETSISAIAQPVILCGHSHVPRTVSLPQGKLIINPGSVGLPAYTMEAPFPYAMESGSPHARYALLRRMQNGWQVEHVQVPYPSEQAATAAQGNQRADWAQWLTTGRAR